MTTPTGQPVPEGERPPSEGLRHGTDPQPMGAAHTPDVPSGNARRMGRALMRTFSGFFWSWSGRVQVDKVHGNRPEPVAGRRATPSRRDTWIGAGIVAALLLGCTGLLRWWVG